MNFAKIQGTGNDFIIEMEQLEKCVVMVQDVFPVTLI